MMQKAEEGDIPTVLRTGIALFQQGRRGEAEALLTDAQRRHPADFNLLHMLGTMLVQGPDPARGVALIETALEQRKDFAPAYNNLGNGYRRLQQHAAAKAAYEYAITLRPDFAEAYNNRGNTLVFLGRPLDALADFATAVRLNPAMAEAHNNRAVALLKLQRASEALVAADRALSLQADFAEALISRAEALLVQGDKDGALESAEMAVRMKPGLAEAHACCANVLLALGRAQEALAGYEEAIRLNPSLASACNNRGNALRELGRLSEALDSYDAAIHIQPDFAEALNNRGRVLTDLQDPHAALESFDRAVALAPGFDAAHSNRGNALLMLGKPDAALAAHDAALAVQPDNFRAHNNRGNALLDLKRIDEALESYARTIALVPDYAEGHWNRGIALLLQGRLKEGWPEYEFRHRCAGFAIPPDIYPADQLWTGAQDLSGKTLLIHCEQGIGDTIQFCRYARVARSRGARVLLVPHKGLGRLLAGLGPDIAIIDGDPTAHAYDYHVPLLNMPQACGTRLENIPSSGAYLSAEPDRIAHWRDRIGQDGLKIGICWQGNPTSPSDIGRSFPVRLFERIGGLAGVRLIALQKGPGLEQLDDLPQGMAVERPPAPFDDGGDAFLDTAAVMANLDMIITSDTAVAHLAGALGRPTIVALKYVPDWRWLLDRSDTPWYPRMQLVRQEAHGDWAGVFTRIESQLPSMLRQN
ncbi:MAG TPA: tetratricopeptide repeat protein [Rhizomicrobium sp.]|nr:tetratricopeptide repeat protein [Rhizomicrobium sp.]